MTKFLNESKKRTERERSVLLKAGGKTGEVPASLSLQQKSSNAFPFLGLCVHQIGEDMMRFDGV